jgi:hypothetical protein
LYKNLEKKELFNQGDHESFTFSTNGKQLFMLRLKNKYTVFNLETGEVILDKEELPSKKSREFKTESLYYNPW